ncbi:Zn-ribbon domain-containing OB-fold protein [Ramlibacter sp.]|uniref:Zn-ribbon domain-containing OB-fold protein n=1 Tax=Ramlibacter sp. TaxID=1917967 RepID=UPI003D0A0F79
MITAEDALKKPAPQADGDTLEFWRGVREGQLLLQHCLDCKRVQFYQQRICRECGSGNLEHRPASGRGKVHSFSVVHRAPGPAFKGDVPYAVLLVELEEGPRMISGYAGDDPGAVTFDQDVELVIDTSAEVPLPKFRLARR